MARDANGVQLPIRTLQLGKLTDAESPLGPQLPCGKQPVPSYPALTDSAVVKSWSKSELGDNWKPPGCTGWTEVGFTTLVTVAARFSHPSGTIDLRQHIGAISQLKGLRYWSTTKKRWQVLIVDAYALSEAEDGKRRRDFAPDEIKEGNLLYFEQVDNLSSGIYKMRILEASETRLVFGIENLSTIRFHLLPIFHPGELQSMYFLDRESDKVWRYYSILRTGRNANGLIAGNESSSINRTVAFYRFMVRIPSTREPPAAP
jgi:uncharacterized protein DUF6675